MIQQTGTSQLSKLIPLGFTTLTNQKGIWVYVSDIDALKSKFEAMHPTKTIIFTPGPCLYFYHISIIQKRLNN